MTARVHLDQLPAAVRARVVADGVAVPARRRRSPHQPREWLPLVCATCGEQIEPPSDYQLARHGDSTGHTRYSVVVVVAGGGTSNRPDAQ